MNHFYQEYIANKEHVHMNSTKWPSLTEFAKHLGREGICRVEDLEKGLHVAWIDNSPEALRRQDAIKKKERQDRGDEEREQALIREQIARAERDAAEKAGEDADEEEARILRREEGEKIKLNFGGKLKETTEPSPLAASTADDMQPATEAQAVEIQAERPSVTASTPSVEKISLKMGSGNKPKNVFASSSKKNALNGAKAPAKEETKRPMSEAERIMREEIERKRYREANGFSGLNAKRQRIG